MTNVRSAAMRVQSFLDRQSEMCGVDPEMLMVLDGNRYILRASDLRALVAAVVTQESDRHDYEPDHGTAPSPMSTDAPCRVCGQARRYCEGRP